MTTIHYEEEAGAFLDMLAATSRPQLPDGGAVVSTRPSEQRCRLRLWLWCRFPEIRREICEIVQKHTSGNFPGNLRRAEIAVVATRAIKEIFLIVPTDDPRNRPDLGDLSRI